MNNFKILDSTDREVNIPETLHPGEVLAMELAARGLKKNEFAENLGVKPSHLSALLHGKRHVSAGLALRLERLLGIGAEFWMRLQTSFDISIERQKEHLPEYALAA